MTTKKDDPGKDANKPADTSQQKRPYATIDLKATEVKSSQTTGSPPSQSAAAATSVPGTGAARPEEAKPGEAKPAAAAATEKKPEPVKPADPKAAASQAAARPTTAPAPRSGSRIGSFLSHTLAGVVGGALMLFGADSLTPHLAELGLPVPAAGKNEATAALDKRLAAIELAARTPAVSQDIAQKLAAAEARLAKLDDVQKSLAALSEAQTRAAAQTKALTDKVGADTAPEGTAGRISKLEQVLQTLSAAAGADPQKGGIPQMAALSGKMADLEQTIANQMTAVRRSVGEQIEARVGQIAESSEAAKAGTQRIDRDLAAIKTDTAKLAQRMEAAKAESDRQADALRAVQQEAGSLRSALDGFKGDVDARLKTLAKPADVTAAVAPVTGKLSALEENLQSVVKSEQDRRVTAERIVLSLELGNLKRAMDRGQKYAAELAEVKKASGGRIDLSALDKYKDQGVPTIADLQRQFRSVANSIITADEDPADGSVVDRLLAGAKSVVRVRKTTHAADDMSAEAIAARMESALKDGRLAEVGEHAAKLKPKAAAVAKDWLGKVEARAAIDKALSIIDSQLKSSLAAAPAATDKVTK